MNKWEYTSVRFSWSVGVSIAYLPDGTQLRGEDAHEHLNQLGAQGWELIDVGHQGHNDRITQIL